MRRLPRPLLLASCLAFPACLVGFPHPLGPVGSAFIDQRLLGDWQCAAGEDSTPGAMTVIDFDEKQYYMRFAEEEGKEPSHARAYATRVGGVPFLNMQEIGAHDDRTWVFLDYAFPDEGHLNMRVVDPQPFKEVIESEHRVRKLLERRLKSADLFVNFLSCVRAAKTPE